MLMASQALIAISVSYFSHLLYTRLIVSSISYYFCPQKVSPLMAYGERVTDRFVRPSD